MKTKHIIIFFVFIFGLRSLICQDNKKEKINDSRYCFQSYFTKGQKISAEQQLISFLKNINDVETERIDKKGAFLFIDNYDSTFRSDYESITKGIVHSDFKIVNIIKKKNNYQLNDSKLTKKKVLLIDIEPIEKIEGFPDNARLIEITQPLKCQKNANKIAIGRTYEMTVFFFFNKNCCKLNKGVTLVRHPNKYLTCFLFKMIWVENIDFNSYNFCETPNLKGLYYVETKE
jgi:hypothetical protein